MGGYSFGDEIECGIEYFNVTRSGSGSAPGTAAITHYGPKCVISEDSNGGNLVARIEWIDLFDASS